MGQVPTLAISMSARPSMYRAEHLAKIEWPSEAAPTARVERALVLAGFPGHREPVRSADGSAPTGEESREYAGQRAEADRPAESRGRSARGTRPNVARLRARQHGRGQTPVADPGARKCANR